MIGLLLATLMGVCGCTSLFSDGGGSSGAARGSGADGGEMEALRQEVRSLRSDVAGLRQAVTEIHRAVVSPAAGQHAANPNAVRPSSPAPTTDLEINVDRRTLGSESAPIAIVEFTDYECPFCARFYQQVFPELKKTYIDSGKVRFFVQNFPLAFHDQATPAAIAASCAADQKAYWGMRDALLAGQSSLGEVAYKDAARRLGLAVGRFDECLAQAGRAASVAAEQRFGSQLGVDGTPTFFVGRLEGNRVVSAQRIVGAQGLPAFAAVINSLMEEGSDIE